LLLKLFECTWVGFQLPLDRFYVLLVSAILESYLAEDLSDFAQAINLANVFSITIKEFSCDALHSCLLFLIVGCVVDSSSVCECVMHS